LERGKRTQEILKQDLNKTLSMEEEAMMLYCLTQGHLDDIPVEDLAKFEDSLYSEMKTDEEGIKLANELRETKVLPDKEKMDSFITEFKKRFI
ncbi:MAG: F0F1 ATP synthase subunit alpha, partial [Acholeplasmatales bacterium]|nr:F0F1 ATP synthase subunit alpha [Acholeplasmatales bacterium]